MSEFQLCVPDKEMSIAKQATYLQKKRQGKLKKMDYIECLLHRLYGAITFMANNMYREMKDSFEQC